VAEIVKARVAAPWSVSYRVSTIILEVSIKTVDWGCFIVKERKGISVPYNVHVLEKNIDP
jgi:hypothetical protein